jgi:tetratricopeptide (TPR) repeat protein
MRKLVLTVALCGAAPALIWAQSKIEINAETPEGALLTQAGLETDPAKKLALLEECIEKHADKPAVELCYAQSHPLYVAQQNWDKAMDVGEKLLAKDPTNIHIAHESLKAAEANKDADLIVKWTGLTSSLARKAAAAPKGDDEEEEHHKAAVDYAKQVDTYTEYALYAGSLQVTDPAGKLKLAEALEKQNPQSQYMAQMEGPLFLALQQAGQTEQAAALAERLIAANRANEDMLLLAGTRMRDQKKDLDQVVAYAEKAVGLMEARPPAEQEQLKVKLGFAHWLVGVTAGDQSKWAASDKSLRRALPLITDDNLKASALFYLGLANYRMGDSSNNTKQVLEAFRFTEQCAAIKSPFQAQARTNLANMKKKYTIR